LKFVFVFKSIIILLQTMNKIITLQDNEQVTTISDTTKKGF
jgi:hypothetical protein